MVNRSQSHGSLTPFNLFCRETEWIMFLFYLPETRSTDELKTDKLAKLRGKIPKSGFAQTWLIISQVPSEVWLMFKSISIWLPESYQEQQVTSDAGSQYRCGRVGRGIHTPTHFQHSNIHKKYRKRSFSHFSTRWPRTNGPTDRRTDGPTDGPTDRRTMPLIELRVRN